MSVAFARTRNPKQGPPDPPPLPEGGGAPFRWGMRLPGQFEEYAYVSTESELVAVLIGRPEYVYFDQQSALVARIKYGIGTQCWQQARLNMLAQTVLDDWTDAEPWQRSVLAGSRATQPHGWPIKTVDLVDRWDCRIPLILVSTGFEPYSEVPAPVGEIWWIDVIEDSTLLGSLEAYPFGLIDVFPIEVNG